MVQPLQIWPHLNGERYTIRQVIHKLKRGADWEASANSHGRPSCHNPGNCSRSGNKHRVSAFYFNGESVHEESVCEIRPQCADGAVEATQHKNSSRPAGLCKPRLKDHYHLWWDGNQVSVFQMEASVVTMGPQKARYLRHNVKVILTGFFDFRSIVHNEFAPHRQTINKEFYLRLRDTVRRKWPDMWAA